MTKGLYQRILVIVAFTINVQCLKNKAMLMNAGKFFYNFRMQTSLMTMRYILQDLGFDEKDVDFELRKIDSAYVL